ncbi:hypothetical protein V6Z11_D11G132900 [Gossypium hirsutum]
MKAEFGQPLDVFSAPQNESHPCHPWKQYQHQHFACKDNSLHVLAWLMLLNVVYITRLPTSKKQIENWKAIMHGENSRIQSLTMLLRINIYNTNHSKSAECTSFEHGTILNRGSLS